MANNAGVSGWSIPIVAGQVPAYIAVQPPLHWSGVVSDVTITALTGETELLDVESSAVDFDITVVPVADGLDINPANITGTEGSIIAIDINPSLLDQGELVNLSLVGLGKYAAFHLNGSLMTAGVVYDEINDTYTLSNLTETELGQLGFVQSAGIFTVNVSAETVDGVDISSAVTDSFTATVTAVGATSGDDTLLYGGLMIDALGGEDTIQLRFGEDVDASDIAANLSNIEIIDLSISGSNTLGGSANGEGLSIQDVLDVTDAGNVLNIEGDAADTVNISASWTGGLVSGGYAVYTDGGSTTLNVSENIVVNLVTD